MVHRTFKLEVLYILSRGSRELTFSCIIKTIQTDFDLTNCANIRLRYNTQSEDRLIRRYPNTFAASWPSSWGSTACNVCPYY